MTPESALEIFGEAFFLVVMLVNVVILPSLLVGLMVSVFQAATQINEQTLSFLPRLLTILTTVMLAGPWMLNRVLDFTRRLILNLPTMIG